MKSIKYFIIFIIFFIVFKIDVFASKISKFSTPTPIICGTSRTYNINIFGTDTFTSAYQWQFINSTDSINGIINTSVTTQNLDNKKNL